MDKIRIVCLGGLDEFYKACTVIEINDDIFVVECGLKFPDVTNPGIDYVVARSDYLVENKHRIKAYFLTYGHDSVIGGLPYVYKNAPAPVYCTDITNSFGIAFDTDQGNIVYLGNCVFDNNRDVGFSLDLVTVTKIASKPTLVLLQDSAYATKSGYTNPNYRIMPLIKRQFEHATGRIIMALEAPDIYNIIAVINEALKCGRKIVSYDQSTTDVINVLIETNCLKLAKKDILPMEEVNRIRAQEIMILITGFGSKLYNKVSLLATHLNDDQILRINPTDTVFLATHAENDAEIAQSSALNELYRNDCEIISISSKTFIKMHASEEDLKTSLSIFHPKYYIPITGSLVNLFANAKIAVGMNIGLNHNNVLVLDNGIVVEFENYFAKVLPNKIITGNVYVDGKGVGDIHSEVLEERQKFSDDGVIIVAATISKSKREIVLGPDIQTRGLIFVKESDSLIKEIERVLVANITLELSKPNYSLSYMEMTIKDQIFKTIRRAMLKSPTIIPIIVEIE